MDWSRCSNCGRSACAVVDFLDAPLAGGHTSFCSATAAPAACALHVLCLACTKSFCSCWISDTRLSTRAVACLASSYAWARLVSRRAIWLCTAALRCVCSSSRASRTFRRGSEASATLATASMRAPPRPAGRMLLHTRLKNLQPLVGGIRRAADGQDTLLPAHPDGSYAPAPALKNLHPLVGGIGDAAHGRDARRQLTQAGRMLLLARLQDLESLVRGSATLLTVEMRCQLTQADRMLLLPRRQQLEAAIKGFVCLGHGVQAGSDVAQAGLQILLP